MWERVVSGIQLADLRVRERPADRLRGQTLFHHRVFIHILRIIVIDELESRRLPEHHQMTATRKRHTPATVQRSGKPAGALSDSLIAASSPGCLRKSREDGLEHERRERGAGDHPSHGVAVVHWAGSRRLPQPHGPRQQRQPGQQRDAARDQPLLQVHQLKEMRSWGPEAMPSPIANVLVKRPNRTDW